MAVNLKNAEKALKTVYLDAVSEQLNLATNPLLAKIKQCTDDIYGNEVRKLAIYGVNGGVGAGSEDGELPMAGGNNYKQFVSKLKNLYGTIEISDKAVRVSENNSSAFVNLLNAEMESLIRSSSFNFGRMLFGNGSGALADVMSVNGFELRLDSVRNVVEGMIVDIRDTYTGDMYPDCAGRRITNVDRKNKTVTVNGSSDSLKELTDATLYVQNTFYNEVTGIDAIFNLEDYDLYGIERSKNSWIEPYIETDVGEIDENILQKAIDTIEENSGSTVNFIVCSWGVRRALQKALAKNQIRMSSLTLEGGFNAISFNGIPVVADRFCPEGTMYLLNTNDFTLNQLCDWEWLADDDGKILKQIPGRPVYSATLVKYAELICSRPCGQGKLSGIIEE